VRVELAEPRTEEEFEEYYRLRYERLRQQHGLPPGSERNHPAEAGSSHLVAKAGGRIVGAACWAVGVRTGQTSGGRDLYVRFRQLAVEEEFDGRGIGIVLTRQIERVARSLGAKEIVANVRLDHVPYFEHMGYVVHGKGETLFGDVEHMSMVKPLG
jgi:predicted N-acetyltransferase YhbS